VVLVWLLVSGAVAADVGVDLWSREVQGQGLGGRNGSGLSFMDSYSHSCALYTVFVLILDCLNSMIRWLNSMLQWNDIVVSTQGAWFIQCPGLFARDLYYINSRAVCSSTGARGKLFISSHSDPRITSKGSGPLVLGYLPTPSITPSLLLVFVTKPPVRS
jgi:hypothetical protein